MILHQSPIINSYPNAQITTGFNPNNHLVYSNRAYCYFHRKEKWSIVNAFKEIMECLRLQPTYSRGWYQYGEIMEEMGIPSLTSVALLNGWTLSSVEGDNDGIRACFKKHAKFLDSLRENNPEEAEEVGQFVKEFLSEPLDRKKYWDAVCTVFIFLCQRTYLYLLVHHHVTTATLPDDHR